MHSVAAGDGEKRTGLANRGPDGAGPSHWLQNIISEPLSACRQGGGRSVGKCRLSAGWQPKRLSFGRPEGWRPRFRAFGFKIKENTAKIHVFRMTALRKSGQNLGAEGGKTRGAEGKPTV